MSKSYATFSVNRSWQQVRHVWRERDHADESMARLLRQVRRDQARIEDLLEKPLEGCRILEIGPGQGLERARYFRLANEVVGIDYDVIPRGFDPGAYVRMLRQNGPGRLSKTIGRKLLIGRANDKAWSKAVGVPRLPLPAIRQGDICEPIEEAEPFDVVMSWSAFEHLTEPERAIENVVHVLRPGGVLYISIHIFTSNNGHHDIRAFTGGEDELPLWGHLRPSTEHLIEASCYLNEWRLGQWRDLFGRLAPGAREFLEEGEGRERFWNSMTPEIRAELGGFTDEELRTVDVIYAWRKPG